LPDDQLHKMNLILFVRFFLNIARWNFDYFGSSKYYYLLVHYIYQLNKDILDFES